jgi:hypothetical protein
MGSWAIPDRKVAQASRLCVVFISRGAQKQIPDRTFGHSDHLFGSRLNRLLLNRLS